MPPTFDAPCPCQPGDLRKPATYSACCGRYHAGGLQYLEAPTAEALMRSRYSAFVKRQVDYLLATWHPRTRPERLEPDVSGVRWLGLEVRRHQPVDDTHAVVEFVARNKYAGRAQRLHELSRFIREQGRWFYVNGDIIE